MHEDRLHFVDLPNTQILILALEASRKLEWNIEGIAFREIVFYIPIDMRSQGEEVTLTIKEGNSGEISVRSQCASVQLVDYGKNRKNIQKLQEAIEEIKSILTPEELAQKANELEEDLTRPSTEEERRLQIESEKESSFIHFFIPRKGFIMTPALVDINIFVFVLMAATEAGILEPSTLVLLNWGADFGLLTLTGNWWRAITCNFVHIGAFHLLMNIYAFIYISIWLEHLTGTCRMLIPYLLTGLCSAVPSLYMHAETISTGVSGSIFGPCGIFLAFLLSRRIERLQRKALLTSILTFVGYNFIHGIRAGIDNAAHTGGLSNGFLLGFIYVFGERMKKPEAGRIVSTVGELIIFSVFPFSFPSLCRNVPSTYQEIRNEWKGGLAETYYKEQEEERKKSANRRATGSPRKSSTSEQLPYTPMSSEDMWLSCYDVVSKFSCQYSTNWYKITGTKASIPDSEPPLLKLVNDGSQLIVTSNSYDTQDEFERMKKLLLTSPQSEQGKPSEDYKQSKVNTNGLLMTKTTNPLRIGHSDKEGEETQQAVSLYFRKNKGRVFTIVMLVVDEKAQADLDVTTSSIQIEKQK